MTKKFKMALLWGFLFLAGAASLAFAGGLYTNGLPTASGSLTGLELVPADTQLCCGLNPQTEAISTAQLQQFVGGDASYTANTATTSTVATAASLTGNGGFVVLDMTGSLGAGATLTTPTAAALIAQLPSFKSGGSYVVRIINRTAATNAWTLTAGSNVTVTGTATIAAAAWVDWVVTLNQTLATPTVVFQRIGAGTN